MCNNTTEYTYVCINCGSHADELYRDYKGGIIKIEHCKLCKEVVDKYIESEPIIIFLDALLLKKQAFRHILNNRKLEGYWKLLIILLLCDAFSRLVDQHPDESRSRSMPDYFLYSTLEWGLYRNYLIALTEFLILIFLVNCFVGCLKVFYKNLEYFPRPSLITKGMLLSNFGKILVIPAILWGKTYSDVYLILSKIFVLVANIQAFRVLCPTQGIVPSVVSVGLSHIGASAISLWIQQALQNTLFN